MNLDNVKAATVVDVRPGDVIVLIPETRNLTAEMARTLKEQAQHVWPDNKIVVVSGVEISVQRAGEA